MSSFWINFIVQVVTAALGALVQHPLVTSENRAKVLKVLQDH